MQFRITGWRDDARVKAVQLYDVLFAKGAAGVDSNTLRNGSGATDLDSMDRRFGRVTGYRVEGPLDAGSDQEMVRLSVDRGSHGTAIEVVIVDRDGLIESSSRLQPQPALAKGKPGAHP